FRGILSYIGHMNERCRETGRRLFPVIFPNRIQVENREALTSGVYDAQRPDRDILRYCDELGMPCLDLLPVLSAAWERAGRPLDYGVDRHRPRRGEGLASDAIATFLPERGAP